MSDNMADRIDDLIEGGVYERESFINLVKNIEDENEKLKSENLDLKRAMKKQAKEYNKKNEEINNIYT